MPTSNGSSRLSPTGGRSFGSDSVSGAGRQLGHLDRAADDDLGFQFATDQQGHAQERVRFDLVDEDIPFSSVPHNRRDVVITTDRLAVREHKAILGNDGKL